MTVHDKDLVQLDMENKVHGFVQSTCNSLYSVNGVGRNFLMWPDEYNEDIDYWSGSINPRFEMMTVMLGME